MSTEKPTAVGFRIDDPAKRNSIKIKLPEPLPEPPPEPESATSFIERIHRRKVTDVSRRRTNEQIIASVFGPGAPATPAPSPIPGVHISKIERPDDDAEGAQIVEGPPEPKARPKPDQNPVVGPKDQRPVASIKAGLPAPKEAEDDRRQLPAAPTSAQRPVAAAKEPRPAATPDLNPLGLPRLQFILTLKGIAADLPSDAPKAYRTFARLNADIASELLPECQKVSLCLGTLGPQEASRKIHEQVERLTKEDKEREALDALDAEEVKRRSFFHKIAVETGNPRLGALVFSVTRGTYPKHLRRGKRFTAHWLGEQIGIGERQAQELIRQAIKDSYLRGHRRVHGWHLRPDEKWWAEFARDAHDHYDVNLARRFKSINMAVALDMVDLKPKEGECGFPAWQSRWTVEALVGQMPWLTRSGAWRILTKLASPPLDYLVKVQSGGRKGDAVYEFKLAKSRFSGDEHEQNS